MSGELQAVSAAAWTIFGRLYNNSAVTSASAECYSFVDELQDHLG